MPGRGSGEALAARARARYTSDVPTFALLLAYDGTAFAGWWRQAGARTVASELDAACARVGEPQARAVGASRTDAGVHARGQVAHLITTRAWSAGDLARALAPQLPDDLACRAVAAVDDDWHACHLATGKTYRYALDNGPVGDPFTARQAWRPPFRLDLPALRAAAAGISGRRDWRAFARRGDARGDLVRTLTRVEWAAHGQQLICTIAGEAFVYRLVRSLVGAMVAVAHGGCTRAELDAALAGAPSPAGRQQAPARGLHLDEVAYATPPAWVRPTA